MIDNFTADQFNQPNEWGYLGKPGTIYRLLQNGVISPYESEFMEKLADYMWLSVKQAQWAADIAERTAIFGLQEQMMSPSPDAFDHWVEQAIQALRDNPAPHESPKNENKVSLGTNFGDWQNSRKT